MLKTDRAQENRTTSCAQNVLGLPVGIS